MRPLTILSFVLVFLTFVWAEPVAAQKAKPGSTKQSASQSRPQTTGRPKLRSNYIAKKPTKARRKVESAKLEMTKAHSDVKAVQSQVRHATSNLNRAQREYDRAPANRRTEARRALDAARMNRANWQQPLADARSAYRAARSSYKQANRELHGERVSAWKARLRSFFSRLLPKRSAKGRRVQFARFHKGKTGSGGSQSSVEPKGILRTGERVSVELERRPMPLT